MAAPGWILIEADLASAAAQAALAHARLAGLDGADAEINLIANGKRRHDASGLAGRALRRTANMADRHAPDEESAARLLRRASRPAAGRPAMISRETTVGLIVLRRYQEAFRLIPGAPDRGATQASAKAAPAVLAKLRDELSGFAAGLGLAPRA